MNRLNNGLSNVKTFFLKTLFILVVLAIAVAWFIQSDVATDTPIIGDVKYTLNKKFNDYTTSKKEQVASYMEDKKQSAIDKVKGKLKDVGLVEPREVANQPEVSKPIEILKKPEVKLPEIKNVPTDPIVVKVDDPKVEKAQEFKHLSIPFYYDHSSAPNNISKEQVLALIRKSSDTWQEACNVSFDYKGDRLSDYVDGNNTIRRNEGLVKWGNLPGGAIGQAHQGNGYSYAKGFVLTLKPSFFANRNNQDTLYSTILHETGHVIGLPHSNNNSSIMFWQQHNRKQVLNETDKTMCKYFRARWQGLSAAQASDKYNLLMNESKGNQEVSTEESDEEEY